MTIDPMTGATDGPVVRATGVGVLDRVMAVMDVVETGRHTASEVARILALSVPTAHRLVGSMMAHGLLSRDGEGRLLPGPRLDASYLGQVSGPVLADLTRETGENAQLWVRRGDHRLCLASVDSPAELRAAVPVGTLLPLSAGGSAVAALVDPTLRTWTESISQRTPGLCSVSAPVRKPSGETVGALCLAAPLVRVSAAGPGVAWGDRLLDAAARLASSLAPS